MGNFRKTCDWSGPLAKMIPHVIDKKCSLIVKSKEENCPFVSTLGDFATEGMTVFGRNAPTHWRPTLLISKQIIRLFAYLVAFRTAAGCWILYVRSYASEETRKKLQVKIVVRQAKNLSQNCQKVGAYTIITRSKAKLAKEEHDKAERARINNYDSITFHGRLFGQDETEQNVLDSGEYLCLSDSQVKKFCVERVLFEYSVEITVKE